MRNLALMWVLAGVAVALLAAGDGKPSVSTFTDTRDGKVYKIVRIGGQYWFAENLNYAAKGSKCYENKADSCAKYGRLYNWETALKACPAGTHLPDDDEWYTLRDYEGGRKTAGTKLKSTGGWNKDGNGTDDYGFSALPGAYYINSGSPYNWDDGYIGPGAIGIWWVSVADCAAIALNVLITYDNENLNVGGYDNRALFSVRCVLDDEKERRK